MINHGEKKVSEFSFLVKVFIKSFLYKKNWLILATAKADLVIQQKLVLQYFKTGLPSEIFNQPSKLH